MRPVTGANPAVVRRTAIILARAVDGRHVRSTSPDAWWLNQPESFRQRWTAIAEEVLAEVMPHGFFLSSASREQTIAHMVQIMDALYERTDRLRRWEIQLAERERRLQAAECVGR